MNTTGRSKRSERNERIVNMGIDRAKLKQLRTARGLSQTALAFRCHAAGHRMTAQQISGIELGRVVDPNTSTTEALAAALGCRVDDILTLTF